MRLSQILAVFYLCASGGIARAQCDDESRWDNALELLRREFASKQYSGVAICPQSQSKLTWRQPIGLELIGSHCEPWWRRDAVSLIPALIQPWMVGLEYGGGGSSLWIAQRIGYLHIVAPATRARHRGP